MADMRSSAEERKEMIGTPSKGPKYPYGLRITLDAETVEKLGLKEMPKVDDMLRFMADSKVISVSSDEESDGDEKEYSVQLQIVDMEIEKGKNETNVVDALYRS